MIEGNLEDVIDKRLKTLKEMEILQGQRFHRALSGKYLKKYFSSIWQDA
jgi:hypothetical protein